MCCQSVAVDSRFCQWVWQRGPLCKGAAVVERYDHTCRRCNSRGTPHVEPHDDAALRRCPMCGAKLWPKAIPRPVRFHDLRHTAATLMLRAGVDAHRVQRILRRASVTTTTGTYGHLALEDLRDAVARIGPAPLLTVCRQTPRDPFLRRKARRNRQRNQPLAR
jgi:hypothetical protein